MEFLANLVRLFHMLVVLFIIIGPFINKSSILLIHFTFCISLLVHWYGNSNVCSLSVLESKLRGLDYTQSFTHQFIAPVYEVSQTQWANICIIVTFALMTLSGYKLYNSGVWDQVKECYKNNKSSGMPFTRNIFQCMIPVFAL